MRTSFDHELKYLQSCVQELKTYLLSTELFWPTGLRARREMTPYPEMTLGNMLLSQLMGQALALSQAPDRNQAQDWTSVKEQIEATRERWCAAWENKATLEHAFRLRQWSAYLNEVRIEFGFNAANYPVQVRQRVLLELLGRETGDLHPGDQALKNLDKLLRGIFFSGEFLWQRELMQVFLENPYWYLWGRVVA